jgi:hypothetical protein
VPGLHLPQYAKKGPSTPLCAMSGPDKMISAMEKSVRYMPADVAQQIKSLFAPEAVAVLSATLTVWAASHFFGVGEIFDIILLTVGFATLGASIASVATELHEFVKGSVGAKSDTDLDVAAQHFAKAVVLAGITTGTAVLLRRSAQKVIAKGTPKINPGLKQADGTPWVEAPPANMNTTYPKNLAAGKGWTDWYGKVRLSPFGTVDQAKLAYYHEMFHAFLRPKFGPLRQLRAGFAASAYNRSKLLAYIEEAMAETYAQLKVYGFKPSSFKAGVTFPVAQQYVTVAEIAVEGQAIGAIAAAGTLFTVYVLTEGQDTPASYKEDPSTLVCKMNDSAGLQ